MPKVGPFSSDQRGRSVQSTPGTSFTTYPVNFNETGLPAGTLWGVTLNGTLETGTTTTITFLELASTLSYNISDVPGWRALPNQGSVTVTTFTVNVSITWTQAVYGVAFQESGLPSGTSWGVTFNGSLQTGTSTALSFDVPNGTLAYLVSDVPGWRASPNVGQVMVAGAGVTVPITWTEAVYEVSFSETGLPSGTTWGVTLNGSLQTGKTSTLSFSVPNGTLAYSLSDVAGWRTSPNTGHVTVAGAAASVPTTWTRTTYEVNFKETGLPSGLTWGVTLNGTLVSGTAATLSFSVPNGTLTYVLSGVPGWHTTPTTGKVVVAGSEVNVSVTWSETVYGVSFKEIGLPGGTTWQVTLNGSLQSSSASSITFSEPNGTYGYVIGGVAGWRSSSWSGSVTVDDAAAGVSLSWTRVTYNVTFNENGLPEATSWEVTLGGSSILEDTSSLVFQEPNATYAFTVHNVPGWHASVTGGSLTVNGEPTSVMVNWSQSTYLISFTETGLANGTQWGVTLLGTPESGTAATLSFQEPNGTGDYSVAPVSGYTVTPESGDLVVAGAPETVPVLFTSLAPRSYTVTFTESGLPAGVGWNVTLAGATLGGSTEPITFSESVGSYAYSVENVPGWRASAYSGTVAVVSADVSVAILWTQAVYAVAITESGLPATSSWSVTIGGALTSSTAPTISMLMGNGTYAYSPYAGPGYNASAGSFKVNGAALDVSVAFHSTTGGNGGSGGSGGTGGTGGSKGGQTSTNTFLKVPVTYWAGILIAVVILALVIVLLWRRQAPGKGLGEETEVNAWAPVGDQPLAKVQLKAAGPPKRVTPRPQDEEEEPPVTSGNEHLPPGMSLKEDDRPENANDPIVPSQKASSNEPLEARKPSSPRVASSEEDASMGEDASAD